VRQGRATSPALSLKPHGKIEAAAAAFAEHAVVKHKPGEQVGQALARAAVNMQVQTKRTIFHAVLPEVQGSCRVQALHVTAITVH
jgi:hypothetical protein